MFKLHLLALLTLAASAAADCMMKGGEVDTPTEQTDTHLCESLPDGQYWFWMKTDLIEIPNPGQPSGDFETSTSFGISNSTCWDMSEYEWPDCGMTASVMESFLRYVVIIDQVRMDVGDPWYSFRYAGVTYDTAASEHCSCDRYAEGLTAYGTCKCAFPWNGDWSPYEETFGAAIKGAEEGAGGRRAVMPWVA